MILKRLFLMFLSFYCVAFVFAKDNVFIYEGLDYSINKHNHTAIVAVQRTGKSVWVSIKQYGKTVSTPSSELKSKIVNAKIPAEIYVKKEKYKVVEISDRAFQGSNVESVEIPNTVTRIGNYAFDHCYSLKSITIPNSVIEIGWYAFGYCQNLKSLVIPNSVIKMGGLINMDGGLEEIVVPDDEIVLIGKDKSEHKIDLNYLMNISYYIENGKYCFFFGSRCVKKIQGNTLPFCPYYVIKHLETDVPFLRDGYYAEQHELFSFFAYDKAKLLISEWEKKKEYETTTQWKNRVTEHNRIVQVENVLSEIRAEYISQKTPTVFKGDIGSYNADYQTFPVKVAGMNTIYVKVPYLEAENFKANWNNVKVKPVYGVVNDQIGVVDATFYVNGKEYVLSETYISEDNTLALNLSPLRLDLSGNNNQAVKNISPIQIDNSLDLNIPSVSSNNITTFAVIIGNEQYTRVAQVPYANNDARIFAEYCKKTLGLPEKNVRSYENATFGTMLSAINDIKKIAEAYQGNVNVIFYYAGHGVPNEQTRNAFLLPVDADGKQTEACYPLSRLYKELSGMGAKNVVVFMDACFSGSQRGDGMLVSARGIALKAKSETLQGNMVVFSAASGDETAYPYKEKGHGMFTYFLLKKLKESNGECTLGELGDYLQQNVRQQSVVINRKSQTPTVSASASVGDSWRNMKLKK